MASTGEDATSPKKDVLVQVGPWGSSEGPYDYEFKPNARITHIYVRYGGCIDSIRFGYIPKGSNQEIQTALYGGDGGHRPGTLCIEIDEEIIEMSGTVGSFENSTVITSLCFSTTKNQVKFGSESGTKFSLPVKQTNTKFVGFHGKYGAYLKSIGAILEPK